MSQDLDQSLDHTATRVTKGPTLGWFNVPGTPIVSQGPGFTMYVRANGNDANDGLSPSSAKKTAQAAANAIIAFDTGGDNLYLNFGAGNFDGFRVSGNLRGGIAGNTANNRIPYLYVKGTGVHGSPNATSFGVNDQLNNCILSDYCPIILDTVDVAVPAGQTGVFLENRARLAFVNTVSFTGATTAAQCMHIESFSYIELSPCTVNVHGAFDRIFNEDTGRVALSAPAFNIFATLGNFCQLGNVSSMEITTPTMVIGGGGSFTGFSYIVRENSSISNTGPTTIVAMTGNGGFVQTGGRTKGACAVASIFSSSGIGTGTIAVTGNSYGGIITLSPTGAPGGSGTIGLNVHEANFVADGTAPAPVTVSLQDGTGTWNANAAVRVVSNDGGGGIVIAWTNGTGPTNLTAGQTYKVNYTVNN